MELLFISILAGFLTVLSPCILPLLPVVLSGSLSEKGRITPLVIIGSLAVSTILFTLLIRVTAAFIGVPDSFWFGLSGVIIAIVGLFFLFPQVWEHISSRLQLTSRSSQLTQQSQKFSGQTKNVVLGFSLGPVFTSCSPTYAVILATVLPANLAAGIAYLLAYTISMSLVLLAIAYGGQKVIDKLQWAVKPNGLFRRSLGLILIITGILIATGIIKDFETWLVQTGVDSTQIEWRLLD